MPDGIQLLGLLSEDEEKFMQKLNDVYTDLLQQGHISMVGENEHILVTVGLIKPEDVDSILRYQRRLREDLRSHKSKA